MKHKIHRNYRKMKYIVYRETLFDKREHFFTFLGAFSGIALIGLLNSKYLVLHDNLFLIGSFGASSVLVYGAINSPLAQPRNLIGGHVICALTGVTVHQFVPGELWFTAALSVALSIVLMQITKTLHPPGGATALIANIGSAKVIGLGYLYVLSPVLSGALILLFVALIFNNLTPHRQYPLKKPFKLFRRKSEK